MSAGQVETLGSSGVECFVLTFERTVILLDCGLEIDSLCHNACGQIQLKTAQLDAIDLSTVDIVLISNHITIMGLPYVTEYSSFKGKVYSTLPTATLGQLCMLDVAAGSQPAVAPSAPVDDSDLAFSSRPTKKMKETGGVSAPFRDSRLRFPYTEHDVNNCVEKIITLSFNQCVQLPHTNITISPISSGFAVGSSNWIISSPSLQLAYVSHSSVASRHPLPFNLEGLQHSDVVMFAHVAFPPSVPTPTQPGPSAAAHLPPASAQTNLLPIYPGLSLSLLDDASLASERMFARLCAHIGKTIRGGGSVLLPVGPAGLAIDFVEYLPQQLYRPNHPHHPGNIPNSELS
jgi:hypothetical protein